MFNQIMFLFYNWRIPAGYCANDVGCS